MTNAASQSQIAELYIDESSQTRNRFLLLGGLIVPPNAGPAAVEAMQAARLPDLPHGEMKWGKVSQAKLSAYQRFVDEFFLRDAFKNIHFHSLVVDTSKIRDHVFNNGDRQIGFNKEIYQLASKFARLYPYIFHLYPDQRETLQTPNELRNILNRGQKKKGDRRDWTFRRCHFRNSKTEPFLQMVDILLGGLAFRVNGHFNISDASPAKKSLCDHILRLGKVSDVMKDTTSAGKFTIWHRKLK